MVIFILLKGTHETYNMQDLEEIATTLKNIGYTVWFKNNKNYSITIDISRDDLEQWEKF